MSDLIDRQAARHALCKAVHKGEAIPCENQTASCLWTGTRVCDYVREIDALPSVQPDHNADVNKKEDVDDCISRRAVKEKLKQNLTYMRAFGVDRCINLIDEIPAVEPESKWISCEEKMPEENLWTGASQQYSYGVLMYVLDYSDGDTIIDFGHTIDGKWYSDTADTYVENYSCRVIAWMLPPSYKENE